MESTHKYARIERERRFLVEKFPPAGNVVGIRHIKDLYIDGTSLRLRKLSEFGLPTIFKLTQKIPARATGAQQGWITNIYLTADEFAILARLPGKWLSKTRHSVPPFGIDVFEGVLQGLCLAEAEFNSDAEADASTIPSFIAAEVTTDDRFTGGQLVRASRGEVQTWLSEYGIGLECLLTLL